MIPSEIIRHKRDGGELSETQISEFIAKYLKGEIKDYQMSSLLMAIFLKGMTKKETWALTKTMLHSGAVLDFNHLSGKKIDKHSTGGIGDKTSLIIGPIVAACGVRVPMISGRGLGKTGGTLDKLESIPGFRTRLSLEEFEAQLKKLGISFIGQTKEICPADRELYSLRDVTGTVESIPLICASIMSKKLAEGIDGLVLDVKFGSGAFMATKAQALKLAQGLMDIARASKKKVSALITDMNQPLGCAVGNSLEVQECLDVLDGRGPWDLIDLSLALSAHMIFLGGKAKNLKQARALAQSKIDSKEALKLFEVIVKAQGGDLEKLPRAEGSLEVLSKKSGYVKKADAEAIGLGATLLGAGRLHKDDVIDPSAGVILNKKIGDKVAKGELLARLFYSPSLSRERLHGAQNKIELAFDVSASKSRAPRLIEKEII